MNNIQKILVMVGCGCLFMFFVTATLWISWESHGYEGFWEYFSGMFWIGTRTNYLGIISLSVLVMCLVGFVLFKDD